VRSTLAGTAALLITDEARDVRRRLGPWAWTILEELHLQVPSSTTDLIVDANVRGLAANLGLSPDTVARALRTLRGHHLISMEQTRQDGGGRFGRSRYRLARIPGLAIRPFGTDPHAVGPNTGPPHSGVPRTVESYTAKPAAELADSRKDEQPEDHNRPQGPAADPVGMNQLALPGLSA
jgi:DNA-binding transcriptional ArsR family regulator